MVDKRVHSVEVGVQASDLRTIFPFFIRYWLPFLFFSASWDLKVLFNSCSLGVRSGVI